MKQIFFYIFTFLFIGCTSKKAEILKHDIIEFDVKIPDDLHVKRQINISSIADSISYISLETSPNCLISEIKEVQQNSDKLFIRSKNGELFCFSKSGKFLNKIGRKGKGPKEYYFLLDYVISDSFVYILDYSQRIALYDHAGKFKEYLKTTKQASRMMLLTKNNIACYVPDSQFKSEEKIYNWLIIDSKGDSIGIIDTPHLRNNSEGKKSISNHFALTSFSSQHPFTFKEAFNDSLYFIESSLLKIKPFAHINQGIHKINFESTFEQVANSKHNMRINNIVDIPGYIFISYICMCNGNNQTHHAVYDKQEELFSNLSDQNNEEKIVNDLNPGLNFNILSCISQNQLVGYIDAYIAAKNKNALSSKAIIKETDNPILVFIKTKNFHSK